MENIGTITYCGFEDAARQLYNNIFYSIVDLIKHFGKDNEIDCRSWHEIDFMKKDRIYEIGVNAVVYEEKENKITVFNADRGISTTHRENEMKIEQIIMVYNLLNEGISYYRGKK